MRRYQEVKAVANSAGFPMVKLGDIAELCRNNTAIVDDANGMYTKYFGPKIVGKCSNYHFDGEYMLTPGRQSIGLLGYVNGKFTTTHTFVIKVKPEYNSKYVYYYLLLNDQLSEKSKGIIPYIKNEDVLTLQVIVPPLETQKEIVATLDRIYAPGTTELAETLKLTDKAMDLVQANPGGASLEPIVEAQRLMRKSAQMVADVKAQMVADVKAQMVALIKASMYSKNSKKYKLSDIANDNPESITKSDKFDSIEYIDLGSVKEGNISNIQTIAFADKPSRAQRKVKSEDIIWGGVRPLSKSYAFISSATENTVVSSGFVVVRNKNTENVISKYLYYTLTTDECINYLNSHSRGTSYPAFNSTTLMDYEVMLPSIEIQTQTLQRLNALQIQLTSLENLGKQAEDNARFILDSYLNTA
jgi:type I restriction enzyme S subunit